MPYSVMKIFGSRPKATDGVQAVPSSSIAHASQEQPRRPVAAADRVEAWYEHQPAR